MEYEEHRDDHFRPTDVQHGIVDLRKNLKNLIDTNTIFCSFELTRVKNSDLYRSFFREMDKHRPLFYAVTCHSADEMKGSTSFDIFKILPSNTLLHLIANDLTPADVEVILNKALDNGISNIFVLRGDSTGTNTHFPRAIDLVRFIRIQFGDRFCICVAGYPEIHPESTSKEKDLHYLKEKVDAGADFIITQIFFEAKIFIEFVNECKNIGISVPIIPGILPISSYAHFEKVIKLCNVKIPPIIFDTLQHIKKNDDEVSKYGLELAINIIKEIIASGTTSGFHLFTFNRTSLSSDICTRLDIFR